MEAHAADIDLCEVQPVHEGAYWRLVHEVVVEELPDDVVQLASASAEAQSRRDPVHLELNT